MLLIEIAEKRPEYCRADKKKTTNDQIYFATLVTTQNFTKMLRKLLLFYRLHIFESDQIKEERNKKKSFLLFFSNF